eukprot:4680983-Prymnesium_polylepis.1
MATALPLIPTGSQRPASKGRRPLGDGSTANKATEWASMATEVALLLAVPQLKPLPGVLPPRPAVLPIPAVPQPSASQGWQLLHGDGSTGNGATERASVAAPLSAVPAVTRRQASQ